MLSKLPWSLKFGLTTPSKKRKIKEKKIDQAFTSRWRYAIRNLIMTTVARVIYSGAEMILPAVRRREKLRSSLLMSANYTLEATEAMKGRA